MDLEEETLHCTTNCERKDSAIHLYVGTPNNLATNLEIERGWDSASSGHREREQWSESRCEIRKKSGSEMM